MIANKDEVSAFDKRSGQFFDEERHTVRLLQNLNGNLFRNSPVFDKVIDHLAGLTLSQSVQRDELHILGRCPRWFELRAEREIDEHSRARCLRDNHPEEIE